MKLELPVAVMLEFSVAIVKTNVFESVPPALVPEIVVLKNPAAVGLPEITPVEELIDKTLK
ncbi:MAG: hypothetical protein EBR35_06705 [Flavobacteriales bacterium]|nr:hypothetical protein [Flavobacteriales bacterium]